MPRRPAPTALRWRSYGFLLINTLSWGAALIIIKPAFEVTTPFRFLFYRYLLAVVLALPIMVYYLHKFSFKWPTYRTIIGLELLGTTLALSLLYFGLARTSAIETSLLATTTPLFVTVAGILFLKEKQETHEWRGLALALLGTLLLTVWPLLQNGQGFSGFSLTGNLFILGHNITTALYFVLAKKRYLGLPKFFVSGVSFYVGLISFFLLSWGQSAQLGLPLPMFIHSDWQSPSVWLASGYMAIFGSIIGLTAYFKGQEGVEASEASWFWYLQPLVYIPLGVWWLGEHIHLSQIIAMALILLGILIAEQRPTSRSRS